jgi:hypothetical protein
MSSFTNALILKKKKKREWEVMQEFTYEVGNLGSGEKITVPTGFVSDLATVPRIFWAVFPPDSTYSQAAVLHDWICKHKGRVERNYDYKQASYIFYESMLVLDVSKITANIMYYGVLIFGPKFS